MSLTFIDNQNCNYYKFDSLKIWNNCLITNFKVISKDIASYEKFKSFEVILTNSEISIDLSLIYTYILCIHLCREYYEVTEKDLSILNKIIDDNGENMFLRKEFVRNFMVLVTRGFVQKTDLLQFGKGLLAEDVSKYLSEFLEKVVGTYMSV